MPRHGRREATSAIHDTRDDLPVLSPFLVASAQRGKPALSWAAMYGQTDVVTTLLDHGADAEASGQVRRAALLPNMLHGAWR